MTDEEIKARVHFRVVDVPCCGNCKWFERVYSDSVCRCPGTQEYVDDNIDGSFAAIFPDEHNVCDLFEEGKYEEG